MNSNVKDDFAAAHSESVQQNYTLKVLFGPMVGCELLLPADDYFLIIKPGADLQDKTTALSSEQQHAAHYALNTLYIPYSIDAPNIILRLSHPIEDEDGHGFQLEVQDSSGGVKHVIKENEVFSHDTVHFAFKREGDNWSESVANFNLLPVVVKDEEEDSLIQNFKKKRNKIFLTGGCIILFLFIIAAVVCYKKIEYEKQVLTLTNVLSGAPAPLLVVKSRDKQEIFVLAHRLKEMEWATQAIYKLNENNRVIPVWLWQQSQDIIKRLSQLGYPVLQLDYNSPLHPVIYVYHQMSSDEEQRLKKALMKEILYAVNVSIKVKNKNQLLAEARQGLDRFHVHYRQITTANGYALIVRDALNDTVLLALRNFIAEFNQKWGSNVINFSINLDENWLQNKSYVDSSEGYLFMNPRHWYFPLNNSR
ncbi:type III secretion system protein [Erwinia mallotivora]|uniref:Type III secretion system protein n=1 Tax=Erwinia mallotivora TaxID=69222 RepID=A0A014NAZ3_9GAMM|nr:type III secretion system protein [Erwinia mallotivora]